MEIRPNSDDAESLAAFRRAASDKALRLWLASSYPPGELALKGTFASASGAFLVTKP